MESDLRPLLISYENDCKHDSALQDYDNTLKSMINKAVEGGGGGGGALSICGPSIVALSYSNKETLNKISSFKAQNKKGKWSWKKTRKNEERINLLADEYINNSEELLEFVAEMESFQRNARDSCSSIKQQIQQYFEMKKNREAVILDHQYTCETSYYFRVLEILNNLKGPNNIFEPSTQRLLARLKSINEKQVVMLDKLTKQQHKLGKKQDLTPSMRVKNFIFMGTVACMLVAAIVTAALGAAPVAGAISSFLPSTIAGGHWFGSCLKKFQDSANFNMDLNDSMLQGTRVTKTELGKVKLLIQRVEIEIKSLLFTPSSTINEGQIDSTMKHIDMNLQSFLRQIEELEKETEKFSKEILKARDEVYIRRDRLGNSGSTVLLQQPVPPLRISYPA